MCYVPVGKFEEEETFPVWTEAATSGCEVLHQMWDQTLQGKLSERRMKECLATKLTHG